MRVQLVEHVEKIEGGGERRFKQDRVEVTNGGYSRVFERKDEPFEIEPEEWPLLRRTGEFEPARPKRKQSELKGEGGGQS